MLVRIFLILVISIFSQYSFAEFRCESIRALNDPRLSDDVEFWEEFQRLSDRGNDRELVDLLRSREIEVGNSTGRAAAQQTSSDRRPAPRTQQSYQLNGNARRDLNRLQPGLRSKVDEFLQLARNGSSELLTILRSSPGRWNLERLRGSNGLYSARLNQGYRVVFRERADGSILIERISNSAYAH